MSIVGVAQTQRSNIKENLFPTFDWTVLFKHSIKVMSSKKNNDHDQNIVLHIGTHFELNEVKQLKNTNNVDINCCKASSGKVGVNI